MEIKECFTVKMDNKPVARFYTKDAAVKLCEDMIGNYDLDNITGTNLSVTNDCFKEVNGVKKYFNGETVWSYVS